MFLFVGVGWVKIEENFCFGLHACLFRVMKFGIPTLLKLHHIIHPQENQACVTCNFYWASQSCCIFRLKTYIYSRIIPPTCTLEPSNQTSSPKHPYFPCNPITSPPIPESGPYEVAKPFPRQRNARGRKEKKRVWEERRNIK